MMESARETLLVQLGSILMKRHANLAHHIVLHVNPKVCVQHALMVSKKRNSNFMVKKHLSVQKYVEMEKDLN